MFTYREDGFTVGSDSGPISVQWSSIDRLIGYKIDRYTTDLICLDVEYGDRRITVHEDLAGWFVFLDQCKAVFPEIPHDWEFIIAQPPFETNLTVLLERKEGSGKA